MPTRRASPPRPRVIPTHLVWRLRATAALRVMRSDLEKPASRWFVLTAIAAAQLWHLFASH